MGGSYLFESDSGIDFPEFTYETQIINDGTIEKSAGTGTTTLSVEGPLTNTGTIQVDSGTLDLEPTSVIEVSGTTLTGGTWTAQNGSTLDFPNGTVITDNRATVSLAVPARRSSVLNNWPRTKCVEPDEWSQPRDCRQFYECRKLDARRGQQIERERQ